MLKYKYKLSGIEWIGKIPVHWKYDKLFRVCSNMGSGGTPRSSNQEFYGGPIKWIQSGDLTDGFVSETKKSITEEALRNSSARIFPKGTLLVAMYGATIGKIGIMEMDAATNQACCSLQLSSKLISKFIYYQLLDAREFLINQAYGGGQPNISQETLKQLHLYYPPIQEQKSIAGYLDKATERMDRIINIKQEQLEKMHGFLSRKIDETIIRGIRDFEKKDSRKAFIGDVPNHYKICKLKHITRQITDGAHFTPTYINAQENESIPFLRVTDIHTEKIEFNKLKHIPVLEHNDLIKRCYPEKGDLLLSKNGTIGVTKIVDWDWEFSIFVSLCLIKPDRLINVEYLNYFFKSDIMKHQLKEGSKQITVTNLHLDKIRDFIVVVPPLNEQLVIVKRLNEIEMMVELAKSNLADQLKTLKGYRKSLIHECVTGKKQVAKKYKSIQEEVNI